VWQNFAVVGFHTATKVGRVKKKRSGPKIEWPDSLLQSIDGDYNLAYVKKLLKTRKIENIVTIQRWQSGGN